MAETSLTAAPVPVEADYDGDDSIVKQVEGVCVGSSPNCQSLAEPPLGAAAAVPTVSQTLGKSLVSFFSLGSDIFHSYRP